VSDDIDQKSETTETDVESFVKNLRVCYENDNEIKIQVPGKTAKTFTCQSLGFQDNATKTWRLLTEILQDPPHTYCVGPAHRNVNGKKEDLPFYHSQQKLLREINKKLVNFFNSNYSVEIPNNYKLYELCKGEKPGTYRFKFKVIGEAERALESSKNQTINEIKKLCREYKKTQNDTTLERIAGLAKIATDSDWLTSDEIKEMLEQDKEKEKYIYDQFENIKDREPDY
jgi:hypothetical protein